MSSTFHYIARAIIEVKGQVLLCRELGAANTFLPGGHIESGEKAEVALAREIEEEIGRLPHVGRFVGAVEAGWQDHQGRHHEVNLLFEAHVPGLDTRAAPPSQEAHLEFLWVARADLQEHNLLPAPLNAYLSRFDENGRAFCGSAL